MTNRTPPGGWAILDGWMHEIDLTDTTHGNALDRFNYAAELGLGIGLTSVVSLIDPDIPEDRLASEVLVAVHNDEPGRAVYVNAKYLTAVVGDL